jgi:hypothetical protein
MNWYIICIFVPLKILFTVNRNSSVSMLADAQTWWPGQPGFDSQQGRDILPLHESRLCVGSNHSAGQDYGGLFRWE